MAKKAANARTTSNRRVQRQHRSTLRTQVERRASIRMYRLGIGSCFLVSFPRRGRTDFRILIDCGVHYAQSNGRDRIRGAVQDLMRLTGGKIDVVVATHEQQDNLSGFPEVQEVFGADCAREIWTAWTQNLDDPLAKNLRAKMDATLTTLYGALMRMRLAGRAHQEEQLSSMLGFFGDETGPKLKLFNRALRSLSTKTTYLKPGDPPIEIVEDRVRAFVLGPPVQRDLLQPSDPANPDKEEIFGFGSDMSLFHQLKWALSDNPLGPFDDRFSLPLEGTKALSFFKRHYWAGTTGENLQEPIENTQDWRRIDFDWMDTATALALQLDQDTNNTSLVLAFELGPKKEGGPVLLFAADAQVRNWLSWQDVTWKFEGRTIKGPDLLERTILYKVSHYASHLSTLSKLGLEQMASLKLALVPTDDELASKLKWGTLPWKPLLDRLTEKTAGGVIRTDRSFGTQKLPTATVTETSLYYEIEV